MTFFDWINPDHMTPIRAMILVFIVVGINLAAFVAGVWVIVAVLRAMGAIA